MPWGGGLFRLRNVTIVGYFYSLILLKLLHVTVVGPSSNRNTRILARIYSTGKKKKTVVSRVNPS
jgi:hypothetical protein